MYHPNSLIHWADIESTKVSEDNISTLFRQYSMNAIEDKVGDPERPHKVFTIDFSEKNVKVKDVFGWTQLMLLRKFELNEPITWSKVRSANRTTLLAPDTKVLIFLGPHEYVKGFHGELRYKHTVKDFKDIVRSGSKIASGYFRLIGGIANGEEKEFSNELVELSTVEGFSYFDIVTRSKGFNYDYFYMYAG